MPSLKPYPFLLICFGFCGLMMLIEVLNERFLLNDFKVYYEASSAFLKGEAPYGQAFGLSSGFFKYSPATLLLYLPYTLCSFETAKFIHFGLMACMGYLVFMLCLRLRDLYRSDLNKPTPLVFLSLLLLFSVVHLTRELHMGNINLGLILLSLLALHFTIQSRPLPAAFLLAVLFLLKPYFALLILPMLIARQWRLLITSLLAIGLISLLPALFVGFDQNLDLHAQWLAIMQGHNTGMYSEHTLSSIVYSYSGVRLGTSWQLLFIGATGTIYLLVRYPYFIGKRQYTPSHLIADVFVLMALIPNLVITDSQHFLFSIPLIGLILVHLAAQRSLWRITLFVILLFFYGANSNDLLGNPLSDLFDRFSTIGVANLGLVIFFVFMRKSSAR